MLVIVLCSALVAQTQEYTSVTQDLNFDGLSQAEQIQVLALQSQELRIQNEQLRTELLETSASLKESRSLQQVMSWVIAGSGTLLCFLVGLVVGLRVRSKSPNY